MGLFINNSRKIVEKYSKSIPSNLRIGGTLITISLIGIIIIYGLVIERLCLGIWLHSKILASTVLLANLASGLAAKSLREGVKEITTTLETNSSKQLEEAKKNLGYIVGRDVKDLDKNEVLRATAETASENAIDGIFAPLFWMGIGSVLWQISGNLPGPLTMVGIYKASSTLDSMLGYRTGNLKWLGTAGARLDDILTWLPSRLVLITLPIVSNRIRDWPAIIMKSYTEGSKDLSPNSGLSQAIFANCVGIKMGGINSYKGIKNMKPYLSINSPPANIKKINQIFILTNRLLYLWVAFIGMITLAYQFNKPLYP